MSLNESYMMTVKGTPDIIINAVPFRKRSKRKCVLTKYCLTVYKSIEMNNGVSARMNVA